MLRRDEQRGEARPRCHPSARRAAGSHQPSFTACRIPAATSATSRSPQRPSSACGRRAVAGRAAVVRLQHRAARAARTTARAAFQSAIAWPVGPPCRCTTSGGRGRRDRPVQQPVHGRAAATCHVTARGSTSGVASNPPTGPRAIDRRPGTVRREHDDLRRGHRAANARTAMPRALQSSPRCQPFDSSRAERVPGAPITSRPKPSSLRHHAISSPSGDHANERCARAPRRFGVFVRARAAPAARSRRRIRVHTTGQPSASLTNASVARRARSAAGRTPIASPPATIFARPCRRGPRCATRPTACRAGPTRATRAACRRATTPGPTRSRRSTRAAATPIPSSGTIATSHASSRSIASATSPRTDTAGANARPSRVSARTTPPSARDDDERGRRRPRRRARRRRPRRSRRRRRTSAVTTTGGPGPVGRGDDEVGPPVVSCRSRPGGRRRATTGDRRPNRERATIAGVITAANATERDATALTRSASSRPLGLPRPIQPAFGGLHPPSWFLHADAGPPTLPRPAIRFASRFSSTAAIRTAVARASTAATSPGS